MPRLTLAGLPGALDDINATQAEFRAQIGALNDLMRQVVGNANVKAGATESADPLSAPFTLYVNPYTGSDEFAAGPYNSYELPSGTDEEKIAQKLKRLEKQRLTCGYSPQRPFKTINRAVIEAAIITSKEWYTYTDPKAHVDCVSIVLSAGVHTVYNEPGNAVGAVTPAEWADGKVPTKNELISFNPNTGGVVLPRGCSLCGPDLRKVTIRPTYVPTPAAETSNYSNRSCIFRVTASGYFFGFTLMDKVGSTSSHHLLDAFQFASKADLDNFYDKVETTVGTPADLSAALLVTRGTEYKVVGPITGSPTEAWDTTGSASPYIFNCSVRSDYGMGGIFADGSKVEGLRSIVTACFTGVSLQKDLSCWEIYNTEINNWETCTSYATYIAADPDNVRMRPGYISRHISAVNNAFIQEVSIFAIGQGIQHFTDSGGEITITNSNSSFGGCAALAKGYKSAAFPQDSYWRVAKIKAPIDVGSKTGNIQRIYLGTIESYNSSSITLVDALGASPESGSNPEIVAALGYTLRSGTYVWVENPTGIDWKTTFTGAAWSDGAPKVLNTTANLTESGSSNPVTTTNGVSDAIGKRVYIRRVVDTRTPAERRCSLVLEQRLPVGVTGPIARLPERNFVLQTNPNISGGQINATLSSTSEVLTVTNVYNGPPAGNGVSKTAEVTIRSSSPTRNYANNTYYPVGTVVAYNNKKYVSQENITTSTTFPDPNYWTETFVHMETSYLAEDNFKNEAPILIFDTDTSNSHTSTTLGINWSTIYTSSGSVRDQYRSGVDYRGCQFLLSALGFADPHAVLTPKTAATRERDTSNAAHFPTPPSGGKANALGAWAVEFRRPSMLRLYGHAWEWAGYLNYSKSIPSAQQELSPQNKFSYYFTHQLGGRVVPTGSNEDGYAVSPLGLEDIGTGVTRTVESLGSNSIRIPTTDFFPELTVGSLTVSNLLNITANAVNIPDAMRATTEVNKIGCVRLANINQINAQPGSPDFKITNTNQEIEASPEVVTIGALNQWRVTNRLLSGAVAYVVLYVDPTKPIPSIDDMFETPPFSLERAVGSLARAAEFASIAYPSTATVVYRCAPGIYVNDKEPVNFYNRAQLRCWDFVNNQLMTEAFNTETGGTHYFGTASILDATKACIIPCCPSYRRDPDPAAVFNFVDINYPTLTFNYPSSISGFSFWGPRETITSNSIPDGFFRSTLKSLANSADPNNWRALGKATPERALFYFIAEQVRSGQTGATDTFVRIGRPAMEFKGGYFPDGHWVSNVAFGPNEPFFHEVYTQVYERCVIYVNTETDVRLNGIYLYGNLKCDSAWNYGINNFKDTSNATYSVTGHSHSFVMFNPGLAAHRLSLGAFSDTFDYNKNNLNIHLLTNSRTYVASAGVTPAGTGYLSIGPAFANAISGAFNLTYNPSLFWHDYNVVSNGYQGWRGSFGDHTKTTGVVTQTFGLEYSAGNISIIRDARIVNFFREASSGDTPEVSDPAFSAAYAALGAGEVSSPILFTDLNVKLRAYKPGLNVTTGQTYQNAMVV